MKKYLSAAAMVLALVSCGEKQFHVAGNITNAKDSVLYFENISMEGPEVLDSVKLDEQGSFDFCGDRQEAPEFYRLRISDQIINVAIDSTETVGIKAQYPTMATQYEVTGSDDCVKIKELALMQIALQQRAISVSDDNTLDVDQKNDSILSMISSYKQEVKSKYIFPQPAKSYAYFALFQTLGNWLLFNPRTDRDDIKVFAAVATSWDTYYPNAERGQNLHNIAIEGMNNVRLSDKSAASGIDPSKIHTTGLIDIALNDNHGQMRHLTDFNGKVVLLDFHVFAMNESPARILLLRELYNKYHDQGLEIYQVSLDDDEHFWKQQTAALPWTCVRGEKDEVASTLSIYNVQGVPEYFLIDRGNNIVGRSQTIKDVEQAVKNLL
jgi:peroxiredoxin